jgi:hypothetical protein
MSANGSGPVADVVSNANAAIKTSRRTSQPKKRGLLSATELWNELNTDTSDYRITADLQTNQEAVLRLKSLTTAGESNTDSGNLKTKVAGKLKKEIADLLKASDFRPKEKKQKTERRKPAYTFAHAVKEARTSAGITDVRFPGKGTPLYVQAAAIYNVKKVPFVVKQTEVPVA